MSKENKFPSYSYSFQVDYPGWNSFYVNKQSINTQNELARLDFLEQQIQEMDSYPQALELINKALQENGK